MIDFDFLSMKYNIISNYNYYWYWLSSSAFIMNLILATAQQPKLNILHRPLQLNGAHCSSSAHISFHRHLPELLNQLIFDWSSSQCKNNNNNKKKNKKNQYNRRRNILFLRDCYATKWPQHFNIKWDGH